MSHRWHFRRSAVCLAAGAVSGHDKVLGIAGGAAAGLAGVVAVTDATGVVINLLLVVVELALGGDFFEVSRPPGCEV